MSEEEINSEQEVAQDESGSVAPEGEVKNDSTNASRDGDLSVEFLHDVPMTITVELGVGNITIKDLLQLGQGSILEVNKLAGEPLEVKLNDRLISKGEVVVINEKYGVRLTDVINPDENID